MALTEYNNLFLLPRLRAFKITIAAVLVIGLVCPAFGQSFSKAEPPTQRVLLPEAAQYFGIDTSWKPAEWKLSLTHGEHHAEILIGSNRLIVDENLISLSEPVTADGGSISISLEDSIKLLSRLLEREVTEVEISSAGLIMRQQPVALESNFIRNTHYISYPRFTRLIINVSAEDAVEDVEVKCMEEVGVLTIELVNSRFAELAEPIDVGDRIVELIEFVQAGPDARLIVRTVVEGVKYEIQKHDDPPRIVIDIKPISPAIVADYFGNSVLPPQANGLPGPEIVAPREQFPFTTLVIDPGHGGKDNGAQGRGGLFEKEVTLDIALRLRELVKERIGMEVVLTRTGDYFVSLKERAATANHAKDGMPADMFISIHTNAHKSAKIGGFEAYYISDAIDPDAEATAALENAVVEFERGMNGDNELVESSVIPILWDLQFTKFVSQSSEFASVVQRELGKRLSTRNRGVRQAPFIVLAGVSMPAILIEIGFISNRVEEAKLSTAGFRTECAEALVSAVAALKEIHEVRLGQLDGESNP